MSKKSRRRNKKILAALALAGGAAMLAKGRGKGAGAVSTAGQAVGVDRITPKTDYITKKADVVSDALPNTSSNFQTRFKTKIGDKWVGPGEARVVNPHEATAAAGAAYRPITARPNRFNRLKGGGIAKRGTGVALKHGGRTGKQFGGGLGSTARRDMRSGYYPSDMGMRGGSMYKKGGRVKSRGVAKRGGGAEIK